MKCEVECYSNQGLCTVFDCKKPSIYAGFRLITITLLRPRKRLPLLWKSFFISQTSFVIDGAGAADEFRAGAGGKHRGTADGVVL